LHATHLPRPLAALSVGGVAGSLVLALLLHDGLAGHHVVLNVMLLLQGFTLGLVFRAAHLRPWGVAVLDEGLDTDLHLDLEGRLGVLDEAALLVVLVALLLLLSRVGRCV